MNDQEIINSIRNGDREKPIRFLYKEYPKVERLIIKSGCSKENAKEIFNDSLLLLIEKVQSPDFELSAKLSTFLYGINRLKAKNILRKQNKHYELEWSDTLIVNENDLAYDHEHEVKLKGIEQILSEVSENCRKIFKFFYFEKKSMKLIAEELGYSSTNSAKTQKYKCIEHAYKLAKKQNILQH